MQTLAPHLRANLVFEEGNTIKRRIVKGPVPLFYLGTKGEALPELRPPSKKHGRNEKRHIRSDVRLEPEPFLPAIRAHRYLGS